MEATLLNVMGNDLMVVNAARVSMRKKSEWEVVTFGEAAILRLKEADVKLISYLARNAHWTPFSHPQLQFHMKAPLFVRSQWYRSVVGVTRNEVSRRYVDDEPEFFTPDLWRSRPEGGIKQGSGNALDARMQDAVRSEYERAVSNMAAVYRRLLTWGVALEQARMVLPQSMYTEWYETGSLYYWARICKLRLHPHAQVETRELARQIAEQVAPKFPVSWKALMGESPDESR